MRRRSSSSSPSSLKHLAVAAADTAAMSSRSPYRPRGGRNETLGRGTSTTKDGSHFFQPGGRGGISSQLEYRAVPANHMPHFNQYQSFNRPTLSSSQPFYSHPRPHANQNHNLSMQPPFEQNHPIYHHPYRSQTPGPPLHFPTMIGDSHYMSVRDENLHFMGPRGGFSNQLGFQPSPLSPAPYFNQYQPFNNIPHFNADQQINPTPHVNQNQSSYTQLPFHQNQSIRQPHPNRMQRPSESYHREWEYARPGPPLHCDRFIVLSYNLLADYLAINHWDQLYSHIPNHMLDWNWRKRNIIYELGWWSADIMCFQEVDKFHELEDELKTVGYSGIWKMRTGDAVDGCAIFWRASRFKLRYEEAIEFNKLGLRNNVAQICVLESLPRSNSDLPTSSTGSNKVVICNIHVLFNPRRGEIKLGQVRILLEKAHAVSKIWNDAPIVFCGDFNCTPKSPLYNFFTEQKLDLTCLARDKVSGQEACVIRPFRQFGGYQGVPSAYTLVPPTGIKGPECGTNQRDSLSEMQRLNVSDMLGKSSITGNHSTESAATSEQMSKQHCEGTEIVITNEIEPSSFEQSFQCADGSQPDKSSDLNDNVNASEASDRTYIDSDKDTGHNEDVKAFSVSNNGFSSERLESVSNESSVEPALDEKIAKLLINDPEEDMNGGSKADKEDYNTFLSKLHNNEDDLPSDPVERDGTEKDGSQGDANLDKIPPDKSFVTGDVYRTFYDRSSWTPVEFETATGNADCTIMEHPLKLKSTYTEVEDLSHTRDGNGEPEVTSYNKCFLGTVDYIWRSEGLQTVKTLSPIPKHAMQWTRGFPTKKWGSDHIALASELAFVKDTTDENTQTPL